MVITPKVQIAPLLSEILSIHKTMNFDEYLIPYNWDMSWIEEEIDKMIALMNQHQIPKPHESCKNCAYSDQYSRAVHPSGIDRGDHSQGSLF